MKSNRDWKDYEGKKIIVREGNVEVVKVLWKYAPEFKKPFLCHTHEGTLYTGITSWPHAEVIEEEP